jgi:5'-3' exonuclease
MIEMLQFYQIKPLFVFDGKSLTAKDKTHEKRKKAK